MAPLLDLAREFGLSVVEDAAQAHGARYRFPDGSERPCGSLADAAAFSFYPGKNLGAIGEAGAVTTNDAKRAGHARILRDHGQREKYIHATHYGSNSRLDALQAGVLALKLGRLATWNDRRRQVAAWYAERLADAPFTIPVERPYAHHVFHLYVVQAEQRDRLRTELADAGVATGLHYPVPLHRQEAYADMPVVTGPLPETEAAAARVLSLPMYPHMEVEEVDYVAEQVLRLARRSTDG